MPTHNIQDDHHVVRHCKKRLLIRKDDQVIGIFPELFHLLSETLERKQETYLSGVYFEFFEGDNQARFKLCCAALAFSPRPKDGLAKLNARLIKEQGAKQKKKLRVTHEPKANNKAYAAIRGIPIETDDVLAALLASHSLVEVLEVSQI